MRRKTRFFVLCACSALAVLWGCDGTGNGSDNLAACNPFEPAYEPTTLGETAVGGRDAAGIYYVVERLDRDGAFSVDRLFVSSGSVLVRIEPTDGGYCQALDNPGDECTVEWEQEGKLLAIWVKKQESGEVKIWWCGMGLRAIAVGNGCEDDCIPLELVDKDILAKMEIQNLPGERIVETIAERANGEQIVVVRPEYDWLDEQYRIFVGPPGEMVEYPVLEIRRFLCPQRDYVIDYQGQETRIHIDDACPSNSCGGSEDPTEPQGCYMQFGESVEQLTLVLRDHTEEDPHWGGSGGYDPADYAFQCLQ
jgi:hypothetical protein